MKLKWRLIIISFLFCNLLCGQGTILDYAYQTMPQIGVLSANVAGTTNKARVIKDTLRSRYSRFTAIPMRNWDGSSNAFETFFDEGLISHVVIDVGATDATDSVPWITASTDYNLTELATDVEDLLNTYRSIKVLILDNEELQNTYHVCCRVFQYIDIAEVVAPICKQYGVKLASGGFGDFYAINGVTFRYIKGKYGQSAADDFAEWVFANGTNGNQYAAANDPNDYSNPTRAALQTRILECDTIVNFDGWSLLNFHMYNPIEIGQTPPANSSQIDLWRFYNEAFKYGNTDHIRPAICNETGQRGTESEILVTNMLDMFWRLRMYVVDWWSGNGAQLDARPLTTDAGSLTGHQNGEAYADFSDIYIGRPIPVYPSP